MKRRRDNKQGSVLVVVLILLLISGTLVSSYLRLSSNDTRLTRIAVDQERAFIVAEAGLDYGVMKLRALISQYQLAPSVSPALLQTMVDAIPPPPPIGDFAYVTPGGVPAFRITIDSPIISGTITNGTTCRGSVGEYQRFTITSGCINTNSREGAVVKQTVQAAGLCLIRFGVFYEEDLEILPGPTMNFYGPVHANGDLYLGGPLNFHERLTAAGDIFHRRKDSADRPGEARAADAAGDLVSMIADNTYIDSDYNTDDDSWMTASLQRWDGNVLSSSHGTVSLDPPIDPSDRPHDIIERSLPTNSPDWKADTEREKFANKACIRIHVDSNGVLTAMDCYNNDLSASFNRAALQQAGMNGASGKPEFAKDVNGDYLLATQGVYDVTQANFYDSREGCTMAPVDIYVDELLQQLPQLHNGFYPDNEGRGIIFITRDDPDDNGAGVMPCLRLRNGGTIGPTTGLSIISDLPVYIEGNYNTNNTRPSLVAGDSVTLLSSAWQDAESGLSLSERVPVDTRYHTVIMTGNQETTTGNYNGGLENVLRFLEKWSGKTVTFRGSIIDLWVSEVATADWSYGSYYTAPIRDWGYDTLYQSVAPPGMTRVYGMEEIAWTRSTWQAEGW